MANHLEPNEELDNIPSALRTQPHALDLRWQTYAKAVKQRALEDKDLEPLWAEIKENMRLKFIF